MQLMPSTAKRTKRGIETLPGDELDLTDVKTNIFIGTHYLAKLISRFKLYPFAIAAYNAGENAIVRWIGELDSSDIPRFIEDIPYKETRNYVKKVLKSYWQYRRVYGLPVTGDDIICAGPCLPAAPKPVVDASLSDENGAGTGQTEGAALPVQ
jgi:soluble lytic murein transglycosylase-like protein